MYRSISHKLLNWKNQKKHKPLILRGARQVGKTYSIEEFAKEQFKHFIKIDFEKEPSLSKIFEGDLSPQKIFDRILIEKGKDYSLETTLIFFDEIQTCPKALMSLRYFYEETPQSWVIATGSLLEFSLKENSFPVGRVEYLWMYPLSFREFLNALGQKPLCSYLPNMSEELPLDDFIHDKLLSYLKIYFIVGGMPEVVKTYAMEKKISSVKKIHHEICSSYIDDFAKYHNKIERSVIESIFQSYSMQIGKHLKYTNLIKDKRIEIIKKGCHILEKALVVHKVTATSGELPLMSSSSDRIFKAVFLDIGLMQYLNDTPYSSILDTPDLNNIFKGALSEQFVGQQILESNPIHSRLYFWSRLKKNSQAEVDYLIHFNGKVCPIEIKSGKGGRLKSMHLLLSTFPQISHGIVLGTHNISFLPKERIKFMPLYTELTI